MKLLDIYKKTFKQIMQNPAITLFLVLFFILFNILSAYLFTVKSLITALLLSFCVFMLFACFVSGWLQIISDACCTENEENKNYFGIFLEGIGKNLIPIGFGFFIYVLFFVLMLFLAGKVANISFGGLEFLYNDLSVINLDNNALMQYYDKLPDDKKYIIMGWNLCMFFATMFFNFLFMFYFPAIIFNKKSNIYLKAFCAIKDGFCFLFKNFFVSLFIYVSIYIISLFLGILNAKFSANLIVSVLLLFCYIYFICISVMLIFNYYGQKNNCDNGCDCIRENENIDKSGESN